VSGVSITLEDVSFQSRIAALLRDVADLSKPLDRIGFAVSQRVAATFQDQADAFGQDWAPLSPVTLALRRSRRRAGGEQILRDTGALANSISHQVVGSQAVEIGPGPSTDDYAATHQFGRADNRMFGKSPAPIPARPFLPARGKTAELPDDWADEVLAVVRQHVMGAP
jgi:phage virion morphogenesis protein